MNLDDLILPHGICLGDYDPLLLLLTDGGNVLISLAYMVAFPFALFRLVDSLPSKVFPVAILMAMFVFTCGLSHLIMVMLTHRATYNGYLFAGWELMATGLISWAFVLAVFWATQKAGLRIVANEDGD